MKKCIYYIIIFIILCIFGDSAIKYSIAQQIDEQSPYCLSFASIGANLLESRLDSWAKINTVKTFAELDQELIQILTTLDLPVKQDNFLHQEHDGQKHLRYELVFDEQSYLFTLQTDTKETYFLLTSISSQNDQKLRQVEKILAQSFHCKSYFQYKGIIAARPNYAGRKKLVNVLLKCFQAKQVDSYEDNNVMSVTAFSPKLENNIETVELAGQRYNLQIALRSDKSSNQSFVYLGFPLLLNDY